MKLLNPHNSKHMVEKIKSSLYLRYYTKAHNERRGPTLRLSAWTMQLRKNVVAIATLSALTRMEIEPQTYRANSDVVYHYDQWITKRRMVRNVCYA